MPSLKLTSDFQLNSFFAFLQSRTKLNLIVGAVTFFFILIFLPVTLIINFTKSNILTPISEPQL